MSSQALASLALLGKSLGQEMMATLRKDVTTSGLSSTSQLSYYYLEQTAKNIYPVFYPILASTPRVSPEWVASASVVRRSTGKQLFPSPMAVRRGRRKATATPT